MRTTPETSGRRRAVVGPRTRADRPGPRRARTDGLVGPQGRTIPAGRALLITLLAFAIWLGFDARQLYNSANGSPLGVRRSVAMSILRPIARVEEFFGADRVVNVGNRILSRDGAGTPGGAVVAVLPPVHHHHKGAPGSAVTTTTTLPAAFTQPSATSPIQLLDIGDSIGEDLGYGLGDLIATSTGVTVQQDAVGDTGLARPDYYNWPANLASELSKYHPKIVVALFGGNDWQPFVVGSRYAEPGTAFWHQQYSARVAEMVSQATATGAHVFWVGLPIMAPSSALSGAVAPTLNAVYQQVCDANPDCTYVSIYKLFENAKGQYAEWLPNAKGQLVEVRDPDGEHIAPPAGNDLAAGAVVAAIESTLHIKI